MMITDKKNATAKENEMNRIAQCFEIERQNELELIAIPALDRTIATIKKRIAVAVEVFNRQNYWPMDDRAVTLSERIECLVRSVNWYMALRDQYAQYAN